MNLRLISSVCLFGAVISPAGAQNCTHPLDPAFYETNHYKVRKIIIESPFDFFFLVRQRFGAVKSRLPLKEGDSFSAADYNRNFPIVDEAIKKDSAFGNEFPAKVVVLRGGLTNCQEMGDSLSVDVLYRVFSTDPIPAAQATPEEQEQTARTPATAAASNNLRPSYMVRPSFLFDHTRRGFAGADFSLAIPNNLVREFHVSAAGSSSSKEFHGELEGQKDLPLTLLNRANYQVSYHYADIPASALRLASGRIQARFEGSSRPLDSTHARILLRYGASVEQGNQHSNLGANSRLDVTGNSPVGALRFYSGVASTTRRSELAASYGVALAGAGLGDISYLKHIGDVSYGVRFPGHSHSPWDVSARFTAGGITGSGPTLINDRFFGGNSVSYFISGDRWSIQNGPLIRSIPTNRLTGEGLGGTSFFSTNLTIGKVMKASPMIPPEVEREPGFGDAVTAAENSARIWFADDYEASSHEFKRLLKNFPAQLQTDLDGVGADFKTIRDAGALSDELESALKKGERQARLAQNLIRNATTPGSRGPDNANKLRAWSLPQSRFVLLVTTLASIELLVTPEMKTQLEVRGDSITAHLKALSDAIGAIHDGPVRAAAEAHATKDMVRPIEVIDGLRFEANRFAFELVGIFDAARVWPDPNGIRFAIGEGVRFSIVNINFTLGYALNPSPRKELGQGRGALVISLTYTNLFR
jgi:hypothetical protein